jgi:hypothetical protein
LRLTGGGVVRYFLGELPFADTLTGPWENVTDTSPNAVLATARAKFYRAVE